MEIIGYLLIAVVAFYSVTVPVLLLFSFVIRTASIVIDQVYFWITGKHIDLLHRNFCGTTRK